MEDVNNEYIKKIKKEKNWGKRMNKKVIAAGMAMVLASMGLTAWLQVGMKNWKSKVIQREEIETIKPRTITVNLSDADVRRLAEKSGEGGLTISELLENFIGDLVDGTYSNGSDERMYAEQWYQRCWFAMFSGDTFLKFLLLWGDLDDYIDLMDELESNKKEMEEMTADAEEYSAEERNEIQEYINDLQKEKDYYWNKFLERKLQKESYVFEKEIENIMAWKSQLDTLLDTENP